MNSGGGFNLDNYLDRFGLAPNIQLRQFPEEQRDQARAVWFRICERSIPGWRDVHPAITEQLLSYVMRSPKFKWNLNKGIMFVGPTGTGKTRYLQTLALAFGIFHRFKFEIFSGIEIERAFRKPENAPERMAVEKGLDAKMFGVDDLGEEHDTVRVFGTKINVGEECLTLRYNAQMARGSLSFVTTNLDRNALRSKYGPRIDSRIDEMFNVIYIKGEDLRKNPPT